MGQRSDKCCEKADEASSSGCWSSGASARQAVTIAEAQEKSANAMRTAARYHRNQKLLDDYEVDKQIVLGSGYAGKVVVCWGKVDKRKYALKTFSKAKVSKKVFDLLSSEASVYLTLDHPNVARLIDVYEDSKNVFLVMEHCAGGELFQRLQRQKQYKENDAAHAATDMLRAISYLHTHKVVHRDVKLENFLYESDANDSVLKLIDFGFSKFWDPSTKMTAACGSLSYVAPEVLGREGYTSQCDLWSLGVVVFMLLAGYPPFHGEHAQLQSKIKAGKPDWIAKRWDPVSKPARSFVEGLLTKDPQNRMDAQAALAHPWLQAKEESVPVQLESEVLRSLMKYSRSSGLRRAVLQLMAQQLEPQETKALAEVFNKLDHSNEGTIKLEDLKQAIRGGEASAVKSPATPASKLRRASTAQLDGLFQLLDTNGDDTIYYSDFVAAAMETRTRLREEAVRATFHRLDADHSGTIGVEDLRKVLGDQFEGVDVEEVIKEVTTPSSKGQIGFDAFVQCLEARDDIPTPKNRGFHKATSSSHFLPSVLSDSEGD